MLELQRIIFDLKRAGIGILVTDHNVRETLAVTDRAYIINNGRIFRAGSPEALGRDPEVKRVYLGESFSMRVSRSKPLCRKWDSPSRYGGLMGVKVSRFWISLRRL